MFLPKVYFSGLFVCDNRGIEEHKNEEFDRMDFFRRSVLLQLDRLAYTRYSAV